MKENVKTANVAEMSHEEFNEYVESHESLFKSEIEVLDKFIENDQCLSAAFCVMYEQLLEDRMRFCRACGEYYRAMAERSRWFVKRFALKRAVGYEGAHYEALGRLMQLKIFMKLWISWKQDSYIDDNVK